MYEKSGEHTRVIFIVRAGKEVVELREVEVILSTRILTRSPSKVAGILGYQSQAFDMHRY